MNWFEGIETVEEADIRRRDLAKRHHPDVGGSDEIMSDINKQYEDFIMKQRVPLVVPTPHKKVPRAKIKLTKETEEGLKMHGSMLVQNVFSAIFENVSDKYVQRIK